MEQGILVNGLIALAALLTAIYSRRLWKQAQHANKNQNRLINQIEIANAREAQLDLRPLRLRVRTLMNGFLDFCTKYETLRQSGEVTRSRELVARLDEYEDQIGDIGPLNMPTIDELHRKIINHSWQLQRIVDRLEGVRNETKNLEYSQLERALHEQLDWFASQSRELPRMFHEYLDPGR